MPLLRFLAGGSRLPAAALLALAVGLLATVPASVAGASETQVFVAEVNEARAAHGLRQLRVAQSLRRSSLDYSYWMVDNEYFGHLADIRAPHRFGLRGEVLARVDAAYTSAEKVVGQWLSSPSHRAVVLNRRFRCIGVGLAPGWVGSLPVTLVTGHFGGAPKARR